MGRIYMKKLDGTSYTCCFCHTQLADVDELISKTFHCRHGKAYLFNNVVNITAGDNEERLMSTGMHLVADVYCISCHQNVGWKYNRKWHMMKRRSIKKGSLCLKGPGSMYHSILLSMTQMRADNGNTESKRIA